MIKEKRKELGAFIKEKRINSDWSIQQLSAEIGRSQRLVSYIECGEKWPGPRTMVKLQNIWPEIKKRI